MRCRVVNRIRSSDANARRSRNRLGTWVAMGCNHRLGLSHSVHYNVFNNAAIKSAAVIESPTARWFTMMRCRKIGSATA